MLFMKRDQKLIINILIEIEHIFTKIFFSKFKSAKDRLKILERNINA